jgi:uncharacterized membrane protein YqiK
MDFGSIIVILFVFALICFFFPRTFYILSKGLGALWYSTLMLIKGVYGLFTKK